jgi:hypothetical protein
MHRKFSPFVLSLLSVTVLACSGTPSTTSAAMAPPPSAPQQSAPPPQGGQQQAQSQPAQPPSYAPNCQGCIQLQEGDAFTIIKAQRAMMALQGEWKSDVDAMNAKFKSQQDIIASKLDEIKKKMKVPANYQFDYQGLQFVPSTVTNKK